MISRQRLIKRLRRTIFGVPLYGLITALLVALVVLSVSAVTQRWLRVLAVELQRDRIEQAGQWATIAIEHELETRRQQITALNRNWPPYETRTSELIAYFQPLQTMGTISNAVVYDINIPYFSYQALPEFHMPIPVESQYMFNRMQAQFGEMRLAAENSDNFWMFMEPEHGDAAIAVHASRLNHSQFLLCQYPLADTIGNFARQSVNEDVNIALTYNGRVVHQASGDTLRPNEEGEIIAEDFPIKEGERQTPYAVRVSVGRNDRIVLLQSLTRVISAGGIMFSLAFGCLVIAWTRSSKRFTTVRQKHRLLHDRSPLLYHDVDDSLVITDVNEIECKLLGYTPTELIGKRLDELLVGGDEMIDRLRHPEVNESSFRGSANYRTANGGLLPVMITAVGDRDEQGRMRWIMIAQDMTEQARVEKISARSQLQVRFLSKVVESLEDGLLVLDEIGTVIYANPAATRLADPHYMGLLGRSLNEVFAIPPTVDYWREIYQHANANQSWHAELGLIGASESGVRLSVRLSGASGRETGGSAIILLLRDLSKEKELSRQLASSQRMYQLIFDKAPTGIIVLDEAGGIVGANDFHRERLAPALALPRGLTSLFEHPALLRSGGREALARLYEGEEIFLDEVPFPGRAGQETRFLSIRGIPESEGSQAGVTRAFLFVEDITERVEFERQREQRTLSLEGEKERALEASRLKSQFIATISHELRTPLNAIIGFSQLIAKKGVLDDRQGANLAKIEDSGRKLLRLVNDLLDISRIEAGHMQIHWEPVVLTSFFEDIKRQSEALMEANNNRVVFNIPSDIGVIDTDSFRLHQIVMNLVNNAAKFTQNGEVTITAEVLRPVGEEEQILVTVSDTGVGIPSSKLDDIFDEFYQVDGSATRAYGGTGLGLAISRKLAVLMNGDITASSVPGEGSVFKLRLPRVHHKTPGSDLAPLLRQMRS